MKKKSHSVTKSYLKLPVIALISLSASPWWKREPPILANASCLPDPSSLRPGALFITNCSEPDSGRENPASLPGCSVPPLLLIQWLIPKSQHFKFILFLNVLHIVSQWKGKKKVLVTQSCPTLCDPWTVAHQAPVSMEVSQQEYWSGLPFPSPGGSSWPRDQTQVSRIAGRFFTVHTPGKPHEPIMFPVPHSPHPCSHVQILLAVLICLQLSVFSASLP